MSEPFVLNIDESKIKVNPLLDGAIRKKVAEIETAINSADLNHDGVADVSQLYESAAKLLPLLSLVPELMDIEKLVKIGVKNGCVKDEAKAALVIAEVSKAAAVVSKFLVIKE